MSILDEILFVAGPLPVLSPMPNQTDQCLKVRFNMENGNRTLELPTPWVMCGLRPEVSPPSWSAFCHQLRQAGIPLECPEDALSKMPSHLIPNRIFRTDIEQPLPPSGASGASLVEVTCRSALRGGWGWPPEVIDLRLLDDWLLAVRAAFGSAAPLGLGLPLNTNDSTLQRIARLDLDWIAIDVREEDSLEAIVYWLVLYRQALIEAGRPEFPIMLKTQVQNPEDQIKLLALGASLVNINGLLKPIGSTPVEQSGGYLRSMHMSRPEPSENTVISKIQSLNRRLTSLLASTESQNPSELRSKLRATTERAARMARIPMLGDENSSCRAAI